MSPDLIAFLKAWYEWATNGAPQNDPFTRGTGLCWNAGIWQGRTGSYVHGDLTSSFGGVRFPFGEDDYDDRAGARTQHECPKRLAWVRERLIETGELAA